MTDNAYTYAERMFPEPHDPGIAQPDRAVSSVRHGTQAYLEGTGGQGETWYHGGGTMTDSLRSGFVRIVQSLAEDRPHAFVWDDAHAEFQLRAPGV